MKRLIALGILALLLAGCESADTGHRVSTLSPKDIVDSSLSGVQIRELCLEGETFGWKKAWTQFNSQGPISKLTSNRDVFEEIRSRC